MAKEYVFTFNAELEVTIEAESLVEAHEKAKHFSDSPIEVDNIYGDEAQVLVNSVRRITDKEGRWI